MAHTLFGAALAETTIGRRRTALATTTLVVAANLPDVDALTYVLGADQALLLRRGWTHGLLAMALLPPLLLAAMLALDRWLCRRRERPRASRRWLLVLACVGVWSHPLLDWLNTYGVRFLMPFEERWYYGDTLFIVDPWLWMLLGGALFLGRGESRALRTALVLLALAATLLLFASPLLPGWIRLLWLAGLVAIAGLRRFGSFNERQRRCLAGSFVGLAFVYAVAMLALAGAARSLVAGELAAKGFAVQALMVGPVPADPTRREVVAALADGYVVGSFRWLGSRRLELEAAPLPRLDGAIVEAAWNASCVRGFAAWARFPFATVEPHPAGWQVHLVDARYARRAGRGFGTDRVLLNEELEARCRH